MNNINENRTDKRAPGGEKSKPELKWFILFLAVIFFLPITTLAVVEWFTSADAFAIGITGFMQAVIVYGGLGLVAVIIALVLFILLIQPDATFLQKVGRTAGILLCLVVAFFLVRPLVLTSPTSSARKPPIWSGWNLNIREGSGTMVRTTIICAA